MYQYTLPTGEVFIDPEVSATITISGVVFTGLAAPAGGNTALNMLLYHSAEHIKYKLERDSNR